MEDEPLELSALNSAVDETLLGALPEVVDMPDGWELSQTVPSRFERSEGQFSSDSSDCRLVPFANMSARNLDLGQPLGLVAGVYTTEFDPDGFALGVYGLITAYDAESVHLAREDHGVDVIAQTRQWVQECPASASVIATPEWVGEDAVSVQVTLGGQFDFTATVLRVRGLLVLSFPAAGLGQTALLPATVNNLRSV